MWEYEKESGTMWILLGSVVVATLAVTRHLTTRHAHTRADLARNFHTWHHHVCEKKTILTYAMKRWKETLKEGSKATA